MGCAVNVCGEKVQPGWLVTREQKAGENWVKYSLTVSGNSGKLKTTLIGDYMKHSDLLELEVERKEHFEKAMKFRES